MTQHLDNFRSRICGEVQSSKSCCKCPFFIILLTCTLIIIAEHCKSVDEILRKHLRTTNWPVVRKRERQTEKKEKKRD
jgi:hypothetical protein